MNKRDVLFKKNNNHRPEIAVLVLLKDCRDDMDIFSTLDSVKNQTLSNINVIIIDGSSNSHISQLANVWVSENRRSMNSIRLYTVGPNDQFSGIIKIATQCIDTHYIFLLDDDCILYPRCLESLLCGIKNSTASFVHCYIEVFGASQGIFNAYPWSRERLRVGSSVEHFILLRRDIFEKFYEFLHMKEEKKHYNLWSQIGTLGRTRIFIPEILIRLRIRDVSEYHSTFSQYEQ